MKAHLALSSLLLCTTAFGANFFIKEKPEEKNTQKSSSKEDCCCPEVCCDEYVGHCGFENSGTFGVWGEWIYMQPLSSDIEYGRVINTSDTTVRGKRTCLKPKHSSGYEVLARFIIPPCDCCYSWDLSGSYMSIDNKRSDKTSVDSDRFIIPLGPFTDSSGDDRFLIAEAKSTIRYRAINGEFGWRMNCRCPFSLRLFAGVHYSEIKENNTLNYHEPTLNESIQTLTSIDYNSTFKADGTGPRVGFNANWNIGCGFGLFGDFGTALLISTQKGKLSEQNFTGSFTPIESLSWNEDLCNKRALLPYLDIKLGLSLKYTCFSCMALSVQGGYRAFNIFNALQVLKIGGSPGSTALERAITDGTMTTKEDFGMSGWFVNAGIEF